MLSPTSRPIQAIAALAMLTVVPQDNAYCWESYGRMETIASFEYVLDSTQLSPVKTKGKNTAASLAPATMTTFRQSNGPTRFVLSISVAHDFDHTKLAVAVFDANDDLLDVFKKKTHTVKVGDRMLITFVGAFAKEHVGADRILVLRALTTR